MKLKCLVTSLLVLASLFIITVQINENHDDNEFPSLPHRDKSVSFPQRHHWKGRKLSRKNKRFWNFLRDSSNDHRQVRHSAMVKKTATFDRSVKRRPGSSIRRSDRQQAPTVIQNQPTLDLSPLFVALIPIALFLGAAAAFALSTASAPNQAVATAQQQQQQESSNNNANSANNNNHGMMSNALSSLNSANSAGGGSFPFLFPVNSTTYGAVFYGASSPYFLLLNNAAG